jgi:small-conductance mechanosensitive channel
VLAEPARSCPLIAFGDSSIDRGLRCWISDPENARRMCAAK